MDIKGGCQKLNLDLVAIGAVNFDCIFFCKKGSIVKSKTSEPGTEQWEVGIRESLYSDINTLKYSSIEHTAQIGGSAFLALRSAYAVDSHLRVSYVGVCGTPTYEDQKFGFSKDNRTTFRFLCNTDWLFFDEDPPGLSIVRLNSKNERDDINIDPGANNKLQQLIEQKERDSGQSFTDFLCSTRWIHLSSLADFNQFMFIVEKVKEAKEKNPLIRVSVDPGFHYVKNKKVELRQIFNVADYVFLSESEMGLLIGDESLKGDIRHQDLSAIFNNEEPSNTQVIVIKKPMKNEVYSFSYGNLHVASFWHKRIRKSKILNDTGAGDAFAGGFIAASLSPSCAIHQRFPIEVGAHAAAARLKCKLDPFEQISISTDLYIQDLQKRVETNINQKWQIFWRSLREHIPAYICGVVTGLIAWGIEGLIMKYLFN